MTRWREQPLPTTSSDAVGAKHLLFFSEAATLHLLVRTLLSDKGPHPALSVVPWLALCSPGPRCHAGQTLPGSRGPVCAHPPRGLSSLSGSLSLLCGGSAEGSGEDSPAERTVSPFFRSLPCASADREWLSPQVVSSSQRCGARGTLGTGRSPMFCVHCPCCPSGSFFRVTPTKQQEVGSATVSSFLSDFKPRQMPLQTANVKEENYKAFFPSFQI